MSSVPPRRLLLAISAACLPALACQVERTLKVGSRPPGATVRLDDQVLGETPLEVSFEDYGTRRATFYLEGHRPLSCRVELDAPWWDRFPLDVVSELLLPFGWRDAHSLSVLLVAESGDVSQRDFEQVLQRAEALRRAGPSGPRPTLPPPPAPAEAAPPEGARPEGRR